MTEKTFIGVDSLFQKLGIQIISSYSVHIQGLGCTSRIIKKWLRQQLGKILLVAWGEEHL